MNFVIDHKSSVPLHAQTEELLRKIIRSSKYTKGKYLPNEIELARKLAISRGTLRLVINKLVYEGLLVRKKGVGTRVNKEGIVSSKAVNWLSFSQEMAARNIPVKNYATRVSWVKPPETVAVFFEIKDDKKILKLERLRGTTSEPFVYFTSYFHPRIGLSEKDNFDKQSLYDMLEKDYQVHANLSKEEISVLLADVVISEKLEIKKGSPILFRKKLIYDQGERPIEYNFGYYKPDSFVYTIESRRSG